MFARLSSLHLKQDYNYNLNPKGLVATGCQLGTCIIISFLREIAGTIVRTCQEHKSAVPTDVS